MATPMMHPSNLPSSPSFPPIPQPQQPPMEIVCLIVSKYSPSCTQIFETVKFLAPHLNIRILEIDHPDVRKIITESNQITTVPAIALIYPMENKKEFYEGQQALLVLNKAVEKVKQKIASIQVQQQQQQQQQRQPPKQTALQDILDEDVTDMKATLDSRTQPSNLPVGQGHEELSISSIPTGMRKATEPRQQREQVDTTSSGFDFPVIDDTVIATPTPEGMNMDDILGNNAGIANRERDKRSQGIKANVESMMSSRDALDNEFTSRKSPGSF
jgi:hypothetical protein